MAYCGILTVVDQDATMADTKGRRGLDSQVHLILTSAEVGFLGSSLEPHFIFDQRIT